MNEINEVKEFRKLYIKYINKQSNGRFVSSRKDITQDFQKLFGRKLTKGQYDTFVRNLDAQECWNESRGNLPIRDKEDYGVNSEHGLYYSEKLIELDVEVKASPSDIMMSHGYDPNHWVVVDAGSTGSKIGTNANDEQYFINRYNKIRVRPKASNELSHDELVELLTFEVEPLKPIEIEKVKGDKAFEVDFFDIHVNSDGYSRKYVKQKVEKMRKYIKNNDISKVYIIFGGDFLHVDGTKERTVNDTQLKLVGTAYEMVREGEKLARYIIERLSIVETEVFWVLGNHSDLAEYQLFDKVAHLFKEFKHIKFHNDESPYKAFVYGKQFVMVSHGNIPKNRLSILPPQQFPLLWSEGKFWEIHLGHVHHENVMSFNNLIVRYQRTPKDTDSYEYYKGWYNMLRHVQAYTIHKDDGIVNVHYY